MKIRFPLYAKILFWFFLNLVFLGLVFYAFFKIQFRLGLDSLLMGRAGEQIESVSEVISDELDHSRPEEWSGVLRRFSEAYHLQFYLFRDDGRQLAGAETQLPASVAAKLLDRGGLPPFQGLPPGAGPGPGRPFMRGPDGEGNWRDDPSPEGRLQDGPPGPPGPRLPPGVRAGPRPKFMVHTSNPGRYWVLVRVRIRDAERPRPVPATLLAMSSSIGFGGLFFNTGPWAWVGFAVLFASVLFWLPLVRGITRSISQMNKATEAIAEGRFDVQIQSRREDELGRLSQAINSMAARLAGFVHGQKRFLGDIAHELCSPIARMQVALGILEERADEKQKSYVEDVREELQEMSGLVNELLSFSKAGLRKKEVALSPVPLQALAEKIISREAPGPNQAQVQIDSSLQVLAEPELLSRALANLVRNAVRYAGEAGPIIVSADRADGRVAIRVADQGPGVPEEMLGQIFDPFFRIEASRSRDTGGIGLGLAIVKTCVEACQGTVTARNRQPSGLEVEIILQTHTPSTAGDGSQ